MLEDHVLPELDGLGEVQALIPDFGAKNGMLIVSTFDQIEPFADEILRLGYGFSVISPADDYVRDDAIEMLMDWGWTGETKPPSWPI